MNKLTFEDKAALIFISALVLFLFLTITLTHRYYMKELEVINQCETAQKPLSPKEHPND